MLPLARNGFSAEVVKAALHSGVVHVEFRYELLDGNEQFKKHLTTVTDAEISCKSLATIKRTARFTMVEDPDIDYLNDRIAPYVRVKIPPGRVLANAYAYLNPLQTTISDRIRSTRGGWAEFPLGVYLLSSPTRVEDNNVITRDIEAYDGLIVLDEDKFIERYSIPAGASYYEAIIDILQSAGITKINLEYTDKTLNSAKEFEPGTEKLVAINSLLSSINYDGLKVDVYGYYTSALYRVPSQRAVEYTYSDDDQSVTLPGVEEEFPIGEVPNKFIAIKTGPDGPPLVSTYVNDNPNSPVSTVNRRTKVRRDEVEDIADQEALDGYVQRIAHEATKLYGQVTFKTGMMPMHDIDDVIQFNYSRLGITEKYTETEWSMPLRAGAEMTHEIRRIVHI